MIIFQTIKHIREWEYASLRSVLLLGSCSLPTNISNNPNTFTFFMLIFHTWLHLFSLLYYSCPMIYLYVTFFNCDLLLYKKNVNCGIASFLFLFTHFQNLYFVALIDTYHLWFTSMVEISNIFIHLKLYVLKSLFFDYFPTFKSCTRPLRYNISLATYTLFVFGYLE